MNWLARNFVAVFVIGVLSTVAFVVSFTLSGHLAKLAPLTVFDPEQSYWVAFKVNSPVFDAWFDADPQIVLANLTQIEAAHFSLYKHPIFSIVLFPLVWVLRLFTNDAYLAVRLLFAANAFLSTALLGALARRMKLSMLDVALFCLLFLASSTMLFWYTIPERFSLGATVFLVALHAAMSAAPKTRRGYVAHIALSIATLGLTITNWVVGLLTTAAVFGLLDRPVAMIGKWLHNVRTIWPDIRLPVILSASAFVITAILAVIQNQFFGDASLFFNPFHYVKEGDYTMEYHVTPAWMRPVSIFTGSVVLGTIETWHNGARMTGDNITPSTWSGWVAMILWVLLLLRGFAMSAWLMLNAQSEHEILVRRMLTVTLLTLVMFTVLHSVYGYVTFLYVAHITPFILVVFATNFVNKDKTLIAIDNIHVLRVMVALVIVTAAINNYELLQSASSFIDERIRLGASVQ